MKQVPIVKDHIIKDHILFFTKSQEGAEQAQ